MLLAANHFFDRTGSNLVQLNVFGLVKMVYWAFMPLIKGCPCFFKDVLLGVHGFQGLFMDFKGLKAVSVFFL